MFNKTAFKFITSFAAILVASFTVFAALGYYENSNGLTDTENSAVLNTNTVISP